MKASELLTQKYKTVRFLLIVTSIIALLVVKGFINVGGLQRFLLVVFFVSMAVYFENKRREVKRGIKSRIVAEEILKLLPNSFKIFEDVKFKVNNEKVKIDYIITGPTGLHVVEVRHTKGRYMGKFNEQFIKLRKGPNIKSVYNPGKTVGRKVHNLSDALKGHGISRYIRGSLLFTHKRLKLEMSGEQRPTYFYNVNTDGDLYLVRDMLQYSNNILTKAQLAQLNGAIEDLNKQKKN